MRMTNRDQRRLFYVVQFIELPFENIDDHVCVYYSWIIFGKSSSRNVIVTYPNNEDPLETKERVRRKERPNDSWRFYTAYLKYESDDFEDADLWIARNEFGTDEQESKKKDRQAKCQLDRKLRSANRSCWSEKNLDKPQVTVKPYNKSRKPLPRIAIRRPLSQERDQNLKNKCLKLNENPEPVVITDHKTAASGSSKQEKSIIITGNQVIQKVQTNTNYASNGEMNTEQSTQLGVIKENPSVDSTVQPSSAKLSVEHQLSPQPPTEQQPSPQPSIDRQPSPKLTAEQHFSSKFSDEQPPPPVGQDDQQPVGMSAVDLNQSKGDLDHCQNVPSEPVADERPHTKTPPSSFKPARQPNLMNERSTPLVRHENSFPEPHSRDATAGQSKEPNYSQKTLHWILTAPKIAPKSSSTTNQHVQQYGYSQLPIYSVSSTSNAKSQPQGLGGKNYIEVADNHSILRSQNIIDSMPTTFNHEHISEKLTQMLELKARQKSSAVKKPKNPIDKKNRLEDITQNIATLQYPPNSMRRVGLPGGSTVAQSAQFAQHHLQQQAQIDGLRRNDDRRGMRENFISQRDPRAQGMMNTPAAQNLSKLAHQYHPFQGTSHEQQYLPPREDYLQQFARLQEMLIRPTMTPTLDQKAYHQNAMMNGGYIIQSQPNPINQPIQFLPHSVNQYESINSAYSHGMKNHDLIKRHADGPHVTYKPVASKEVNIQYPAHHLLSQSHRDAELPQNKQDQLNCRDPRTTNTQNRFSLNYASSSHIPKPQKVTKRSRSLSTSKTSSQALLEAQRSFLMQELNIQERVNQSSTKFNNTNSAAIPKTQTVELASPTKNTEVQTLSSSNQIQATQVTLVQNKHNCQCPGMKKTMIDQSTEMDTMLDVSECVETIAEASLCESPSKAVESVCQTDEWLEKEEDSLYQDTFLDSENASDTEIESENEVVPEANQATLTAEENLTQGNHREQSRMIAEQDMLNGIEPVQNSASPRNNETSQVTQEIPAEDNDNTGSVDNPTTSTREQRGTFSLPAEYDPNDTKWTLKYRENKPGLVELIPRTGVYVKRKELKRCIRESNDCRTLARLLLTEIFSHSALSVCSWTGGKAKAFNSVNIDVRPGLDENARMVLLTFVEQYGKKNGWSMANTSAVMSTIRTKINDIRAKHEQTFKA
ncbi:conserved hypothetical protein [Cotesia vestalis bracovirus]|nr:conserved hypothetical protein [Cotesia vestalis bracovirus]